MEFFRKLLKIKFCFIFVTVLISGPSFCEEISSAEDAKTPYEINLEYSDEAFVKNENKEETDAVFNDEKKVIKLETKYLNNFKLNGAVQAFADYSQDTDSRDGSLNFTFLDTHLWFTGNVLNESTDFKVMFNPLRKVAGYDGFQSIFSDVFIRTKMTQNTKLFIGQVRAPIGVDGSLGQYSLPFVHRSQIARNFSNIRALGVKYTGDYKYADFDIGVYDSARFMNNLFQGAETTAWLNFKPLANLDSEKYGKLNVGTGVNYGRRDTDFLVGGAYLGYEYKKFSANVEYSHADGYNGVRNSSNEASGLYGTVAYFVHPRVQLLARCDFFDPDKQKNHNRSDEYTLGMNYFIKGEKLKLVANYVFKHNQLTTDSNKFLLMTQLLF